MSFFYSHQLVVCDEILLKNNLQYPMESTRGHVTTDIALQGRIQLDKHINEKSTRGKFYCQVWI